MKFSTVLFFAGVALTYVACQKDQDDINMAGTWEGNWGFGTEIPANYEKWKINDDGTLLAYDGTGFLIGIGTWEMEGDQFEAEYAPVGFAYTYTFTGPYDEDDDEITGTWGQTPSTTDGGRFEMSR